MILIHVYSPDSLFEDRQRQTVEALQHLEPKLIKRGWKIYHIEAGNDKGTESTYERILKKYWGQDDLIVLEQDIVPTFPMLVSLEKCQEPLCAQAYRLRHTVKGSAKKLLEKIREASLHLSSEEKKKLENHPLFQTIKPAIERPDEWKRLLVGPFMAHRHVDTKGFVALETGERWADLAGLGLARFTRKFQQQVSPNWEPGPWYDLDTRISLYTYKLGYRWHIHYPYAKHNHPQGYNTLEVLKQAK